MNIKIIRQVRQLTQKDLAEAIGVDESLISKYESGVAIPNRLRLQDIAQALGVSVEALLHDDCVRIYERQDML